MVATCLAVAVAGVLLAPLRRGAGGAEAHAPDADLVVYKDQLAEIARDLTRGTLAEAEATRLRTEIGKRILESDRSRPAGATRGPAGSGVVAMVLVLALAVPGAMAG